MEGTSDCSLVAAFAGLLDPRQSAKVLYPLLEFLVRAGPEASGGFEAVPPGARPHVAGV